jgi:predicted aspartyl protease
MRVLSDTVMQAIVDTGATGNVTIFKGMRSATKAGFTFIRDTTSIPDTTAPVITRFTPTSGKKGTVVTIFGSHLKGVFAVRFGGVLADSMRVLSDTVMQAIVDTGATGNVTIFKGMRSATKAGFTFIKDTTGIPDTTRPAISSFYPASGRKGTFVTIHGSNLRSTYAVRFGGVFADSIYYKNDTVIVVTVGTGATGNVSVNTLYGFASKPGFTFITDTIPDTTAPAIKRFVPTSAGRGALITILGTGFRRASAVQFGGVRADSVLFKNDTVIIAVVGNGATGNVSVTNPYGTGSKAGFTFIGDTTNVPDTTAPVIISFTPTSGQQGTFVTIFGEHFSGATQVRFGGVPADSMVVLSDTVIQARVDTGATGNVCVFTPFGFACKSGFTFIADTTIIDTLIVNARTGINNDNAVTVAKPFALYPNPASHYVIWQQPATNHSTRLQLIDISGRVVRNIVVGSNVSQTTIQIGGLHTGVYKLVWSDGKKKLARTLLVQ